MKVYSDDKLRIAAMRIAKSFRSPWPWLGVTVVGILLALAWLPFLILALCGIGMFIFRLWQSRAIACTSLWAAGNDRIYEFTPLFWILLGLVGACAILAIVGALTRGSALLGIGLGLGIPLGIALLLWFSSQKSTVLRKSLELRSVAEAIENAKKLLEESVRLDQIHNDRSSLEKAARGLGVEAKSVQQTQKRLLELSDQYGQLKSYLLYTLYSPSWLIRPEEEYLRALTGEEIRRPASR